MPQTPRPEDTRPNLKTRHHTPDRTCQFFTVIHDTFWIQVHTYLPVCMYTQHHSNTRQVLERMYVTCIYSLAVTYTSTWCGKAQRIPSSSYE